MAVLLGVVSAFFFSSTFVLNSMVSSHGGHWFWAASLRYVFTCAFLIANAFLQRRTHDFRKLLLIGRRDWRLLAIASLFTTLLFYGPLCYGGSRLPAWLAACAWQITIVLSPIVLRIGFGMRASAAVVSWGIAVLLGVYVASASGAGARDVPPSALVNLGWILIAALSYPIGNQILHSAARGQLGATDWPGSIASRAESRVLLVSAYSLPGWIVLGIVVNPPAPVAEDWIRGSLVALLSGVLATTIFYAARSRAQTACQIAAVDATQAMEVVFAAVSASVLFDQAPPTGYAIAGIGLVAIGVLGAALAAAKTG